MWIWLQPNNNEWIILTRVHIIYIWKWIYLREKKNHQISSNYKYKKLTKNRMIINYKKYNCKSIYLVQFLLVRRHGNWKPNWLSQFSQFSSWTRLYHYWKSNRYGWFWLGWIGSISFLVFIYTPSIHTHGCGAKFLITCPKCRYDNFD